MKNICDGINGSSFSETWRRIPSPTHPMQLRGMEILRRMRGDIIMLSIQRALVLSPDARLKDEDELVKMTAKKTTKKAAKKAARKAPAKKAASERTSKVLRETSGTGPRIARAAERAKKAKEKPCD